MERVRERKTERERETETERERKTELYSPWQNRTKSSIRELKKMVERLMLRSRSPECLWDFCCVYASDIRTMMSHPLPQLEGHTPYEHVTGNTPDISEYLDFSWYAHKACGLPIVVVDVTSLSGCLDRKSVV